MTTGEVTRRRRGARLIQQGIGRTSRPMGQGGTGTWNVIHQRKGRRRQTLSKRESLEWVFTSRLSAGEHRSMDCRRWACRSPGARPNWLRRRLLRGRGRPPPRNEVHTSRRASQPSRGAPLAPRIASLAPRIEAAASRVAWRVCRIASQAPRDDTLASRIATHTSGIASQPRWDATPAPWGERCNSRRRRPGSRWLLPRSR